MDLEVERTYSAVNDFYRVRNQATLKEIVARLTGRSSELLSYEDVRQKLRATQGSEQGVRDIPVDAIIGSVGRYNDFTRDFLPRRDSDRDRWTRIKIASTDFGGLPPIDVYKLGEAYFVIDGNHRVSVARHLGATHIQAYVTEIHSPVNITPDVTPDDLIIKAEYVDFLEKTNLRLVIPNAELIITTAGKYPLLLEHIDLHRYYLGLEKHKEIPFSDALKSWYGDVYTPVVQMIRDSGILHYFPQRTETDLYLWISNYRKELESELGLQIRPERALSDLTSRYTSGVSGVFSRAGGKMLNLIIPTSLADGPDAGEWRQRSPHVRRGDRLFLDILVPIDGRESGWRALSQALIIAQREQARIFGLHVITSGKKIQKAKIEKIELEFIKRCAEANISGSFSHAAGKIFLEINQRARWADLVVTSLSHPPGPFFKDRLDSGIRKLVQSCPRPLLVVPGYPSALKHALLAYDGSPKADEGLFVASYLANQWRASLTVLTAFIGDHVAPETLLRARVYLEEHKIDASYLAETQPTAQAVQHTVVDHQIDLVIAGGYRLSPVREVLFGSTVDQLMRQSEIPLLICR